MELWYSKIWTVLVTEEQSHQVRTQDKLQKEDMYLEMCSPFLAYSEEEGFPANKPESLATLFEY